MKIDLTTWTKTDVPPGTGPSAILKKYHHPWRRIELALHAGHGHELSYWKCELFLPAGPGDSLSAGGDWVIVPGEGVTAEDAYEDMVDNLASEVADLTHMLKELQKEKT